MSLDDDYENGAYIPDAAAFGPRWAAAAAGFRAALGPRADIGVPYGNTPREVYDFFEPVGVSKGTMVFVHGGYWKAFDAGTWSHLAAGAIAQGWAVAMPSYTLCPDIRIQGITAQIAAAVTAIAGRRSGPLVLAGHSAGGHLVARMLDGDVLGAGVRARIRHVMPISPVADLAPLMQTRMNETLGLDPAEARAESPVHMPPPDVPVTVWVGADERPVFLAQAAYLARAWAVECVVAPGKHHFDVIDALADPDSNMMARLLGPYAGSG